LRRRYLEALLQAVTRNPIGVLRGFLVALPNSGTEFRQVSMTIEQVRPDDLTQAFHQALARVNVDQRTARVQQCLNLVDRGTLDPRHIWVAREGPELIGVQVCVHLSGSACLFWLPSTQGPVADQLIQAALAHFRGLGCKIAQVFAKIEETAWTEPLRRNGFRPTTRLFQMAHSLCSLPAPLDSPLRFEPYHVSLADQFAATLERTYLDTLDCPELNGTRSIGEVVEGHKAQGVFHPDYWWLVFHHEQAVGVVMLAEMSEAMTWELIYFGLVPEARGQGFGRAMLVHAMHALLAQPTIALTLAVDARNLPALALYESLGFIEVDCHEVLLHLG